MGAPDLIAGIGLLVPRHGTDTEGAGELDYIQPPGAHPPSVEEPLELSMNTPDPDTQPPPAPPILRPVMQTRQRTLSATSTRRGRPKVARRRTLSNITLPVTPVRQLRITDIFLSHSKEDGVSTEPNLDA